METIWSYLVVIRNHLLTIELFLNIIIILSFFITKVLISFLCHLLLLGLAKEGLLSATHYSPVYLRFDQFIREHSLHINNTLVKVQVLSRYLALTGGLTLSLGF